MVMGKFTTKAELDYEKVVRGIVAQIGLDVSDAVLNACLEEDPMSKEMRESIQGQRGQGRWRDCHQDRAGL